mgnify:CR=1 FL=1
MDKILEKLRQKENLTFEESKSAFELLMTGKANEDEIYNFLTLLSEKGEVSDEIAGGVYVLREKSKRVNVANCVDTCGTGGDGKDTFNISTLASFIVAGAGLKVAKHGNYGVSSVSGSSNVMEKMGVKFTNDSDFLTKSIEETNIAILHAPLFHPAMKNVGPIRKELGVKTFFNILGPMVNPSFPKNQMVGVFSLELARMYTYLYQNTTTNYSILHGLSGFDEISLTDEVKIISNTYEKILKPSDFKLPECKLESIKGGTTIDESAKIFYDVISGKGSTAQNNVVCVNAAIAIQTIEKSNYDEAIAKAQESLVSGKALEKMKKLIEISY